MRVFVTGATGFIGRAVVAELLGAGHDVIGLARSDAGARTLAEAGAQAHRGDLDDPDSLRRGAAAADGVIHCAFDHDFARFADNCEKDRRAIEAMGRALEGSDRPLVITSGVAMGLGTPGRAATEDTFNDACRNPRVASEQAGAALSAAGINVSVVRLPQVHDTRRHGLVTYAIERARETRVSAYVGDGLNRWPAAHVRDVAVVYRRALERAQPGARYHAVAEEGIAMRDIAEVVGRTLGVPVASVPAAQAQAHFGWLALFAAEDMPASAAATRQILAWTPGGPGMLEDLARLEHPRG